MKDRKLVNRLLRIISGIYVILFVPLFIAFLAMRYFTEFSDRILLYTLIPLGAVLVILFAFYSVRVVKTGHFWPTHDHGDFEPLHNSDK